MKSFFLHIQFLWQETCKRRRYGHLIHPKIIAKMAESLVYLLESVRCQGFFSAEEVQHLHKLQSEMEKLILLTEETSFARLSADRRMALHASLQRSYEKILTSIHGSQSPTTRMQ